MTLYANTLRALAAPRRAVPIALVVGAMLWSQERAARGTEHGMLHLAPALAMVVTFLLLAPFAWRALFPPSRPLAPGRLLAYAALATIPSAVGWAIGDALGLGYTFLTLRFHLPVTAALFAAGGWGLARDIEQEQGIARARARAEALEREAERARLLAVRAHLDPHFLFNTLNALAEWTREDPEAAEQGLLALSALLREVLGGLKVAAWPVARELRLVRDLLELHHLRDPTWFSLYWDVGDDLPAEVPPLLLLPLAENAIKHGPAAGHCGEIALSARIAGDRLHISLSNPGSFGGRRDGGEGLATLERRLALAYPGDARFEITGDGATTATLDLPLHPTEAA